MIFQAESIESIVFVKAKGLSEDWVVKSGGFRVNFKSETQLDVADVVQEEDPEAQAVKCVWSKWKSYFTDKVTSKKRPFCFKGSTVRDGIKSLDCVQVLQLLVVMSSFWTLLTHRTHFYWNSCPVS